MERRKRTQAVHWHRLRRWVNHYHAFPDARRSGYGADIIGEELPDYDNDITVPDDEYKPEAEPHGNPMGIVNQPNAMHQRHTVTVTYSAKELAFDCQAPKAYITHIRSPLGGACLP